MKRTNKELYHNFSPDFIHQTQLLDLPDEILLLIIMHCSGLSKFVIHFVSKKFWLMTQNNDINRKSGKIACQGNQLSELLNKKIEICRLAAREGSLNILKWIRENGWPWDGFICCNAAYHKYLKILKWARKNNYPWDETTCQYAIGNGHLEILKWARENGCYWNWETCAHAARNGHLEMLKWFRKNNCPWNSRICLIAAINGHLKILQWAHENGYAMNKNECIQEAKINNHAVVVEWIKNN